MVGGTDEENAAEGSAIGGGAGSVIPGVGTAAGAAIGGALGYAANTIGNLFGGGTEIESCPPIGTPGIDPDCAAADTALIEAQDSANAAAAEAQLTAEVASYEAKYTTEWASWTAAQRALKYENAFAMLAAAAMQTKQLSDAGGYGLSNDQIQAQIQSSAPKQFALVYVGNKWLATAPLAEARTFVASLSIAKAAEENPKNPPPAPPPSESSPSSTSSSSTSTSVTRKVLAVGAVVIAGGVAYRLWKHQPIMPKKIAKAMGMAS